MKAWIIYNGFLPGDKFIDFSEMIRDAAVAIGHEAIIYKNSEIISLLHHKLAILQAEKAELPDYIVFTDKDIYLAKQLELLKIPVFNSSEAIEISDDKIKTYLALAEANIAIPKTIIAPKTFGLRNEQSLTYLELVKKELRFPLIIKEAFGSFGEQVYMVENEAALMDIVEKVQDRPFVFQEFIDTSFGVDLRLQVVGDQVVTAMKRRSKDDFRANVTSGGSMEPYVPSEDEKAIAIKATKAIGADFAGVDLLFGKNKTPIVCEVNSNGHIRNLLDCTGINAADDIVHYIDRKMRELT